MREKVLHEVCLVRTCVRSTRLKNKKVKKEILPQYCVGACLPACLLGCALSSSLLCDLQHSRQSALFLPPMQLQHRRHSACLPTLPACLLATVPTAPGLLS